jgi:predicted phosphodiesterase
LKKTLNVILILIFAHAAVASYPLPVGLWEFNNSANLTLSTIGENLIESGSHTAVAGIDANDGAVTDPLTSYFRCTHNIPANGGGVYPNEWSLLMDIKVPASSIGHWVTLYQTDMDNASGNDGDCFVGTDRTIGVSATKYTKDKIAADTWYRVVISVDNGSFYRIYVNGLPWLGSGTVQSLDGRFALDPQILFFADDSGDDYPIICSNIAMWGQALTDAQVKALGTVTHNILDANSFAGVNLITNPTAEKDLQDWINADGNDWQATDRTDWHWPRTNNYYFTPGRCAHGEMYQIIDVNFIADEIDSGRIVENINGFIGGGNDGDTGRVVVEYRSFSNVLLGSTDTNWIDGAVSDNWTEIEPYTSDYVIPAGTRIVKYRVLAQRADGTDCDAFFDDLSWEYKRLTTGNTAPNAPAIAGSTSVITGAVTAYTFVSTDPQTNTVSYQIDWGNGISDWSAFQTSGVIYAASHGWPISGNYTVRARARDAGGEVGEWSAAYTVTVSGDAAGVFNSEPFLQNVSKTAMTISWETDRAVNPTVDWGIDSSYGNTAKGLCITTGFNGSAAVYVCKVRISGLSADTTYHFRANNGSTVSTDRTFTTAPNEDKPFTFGVWGDSQQVVKRVNNTTEYPACSTAIFTDMANNVDIGISTGDVVQYLTYGWYTGAFRPYAANILGKQKPFFVAFGNHDNPGTSMIHKTIQNSGMQSFSFNYGNAHFTCINNSDCVKGTLTDDGDISSLPLDWIEQDLASEDAQNATWRFLFIHVPPYCERWFDGSTNLQTYLVPLMNKYNVQICFSGHTHEYERGMLDGTFYVISGVCSYLDINESITEDWSFMTVGGAQNITGLPEGGGLMHGWAEIEVDGTELALKQHGYNLDGSYYGVIDSIHLALSDFNMDKNVDALDLADLANEWLTEGDYSKYDLADRSEKIINMKDFARFADYWMFEAEF